MKDYSTCLLRHQKQKSIITSKLRKANNITLAYLYIYLDKKKKKNRAEGKKGNIPTNENSVDSKCRIVFLHFFQDAFSLISSFPFFAIP